MEKDRIVNLLNEDIIGEHAAIIQYLIHAYAMGEGEMACEIEAIAREEMRHLDWLSETVIDLGGVPSILRGEMRLSGQAVTDWMKNNVLQEEDAISLYQEHIGVIDDPKIKRLLKRILSDEESHRGDFQHFVSKAIKEGARDLRGDRSDDITRTLNWGIEHEYTVILQYMLQSYLTIKEEAKKELEDQAINEMQHLGWLAEKMVDLNSRPVIEHSDVDQATELADMLLADIEIEREVAAVYDTAASEIDDAGLKELLIRMRDHEVYHADVFSDLLKEE